MAGDQVELRREEHLRLLDQVVTGDADEAERAMREHLALAKARVLELVR